MAEFPAHIQERIADLRYGLPAKSKFVPTVAEIVEMGDGILRAERETASYAQRFSGRIIRGEVQRPPFQPFAQLWGAFTDEPDMLKDKTFDAYADATRALVTRGKEAARHVLLTAKSPSQSRKDAA